MPKVKLTQLAGADFEAVNEAGVSVRVGGSADYGGSGELMRPMEMVLVSLAGCSAIDVLHILKKQRQAVEGFEIEVDGKRADAIPAVYTDIHVHFRARGDVDPAKLEKAVALSMEKYCSVTRMLEATVRITTSSEVV
jgi:putative redox protein